MGTVAANPTSSSSSSSTSCDVVKLESLPHIDITKLSQSELQSLSLCSNSAFDLRRSSDDAVLPRIDRAVFNESAGSRRQTYSRLRGGFHQHHRTTRHPAPAKTKFLPAISDPENHSILHYLKHYVTHNSSSDCPPPPPPPLWVPPPSDPLPQQQLGLELQEKMAIAVNAAETKRKRGRKAKANKKLIENGAVMELVRVNSKGKEVDFAALERNGDDLYSGELEKWTVGLETEDEVLDVLRGIEGQWGSTRKRRKFVDASLVGDALPIGWKLLLGLKRRGRVSLYCRRFVSPSGEQFLSCKDASSYLRSYFEGKDLNQPMDQGRCITEQPNAVASGSTAGFVENTNGTEHEIGSDSTLAPLTMSGAHENEAGLMEIDNLPEVQVQDIFDCHKCNLTFCEKDVYLKHLMSVHQRTTRRYKLGGSIAEGVIIKDGKFECQFCHKVFQERRSYTGHVGVHVRNHVKGSEELPVLESVQKDIEPPLLQGLHTETSKMKALIEITRSSVAAASSVRFNSEPPDHSCPSTMNLNKTLVDNGNDGTVLEYDPIQIEIGDLLSDRDQEVNEEGGSECMVDNGKMVRGDDPQIVSMLQKSTCTNVSDQTNSIEVEKYGNDDINTGLALGFSALSNDVANSKGLIGEENFNQIEVTSSFAPLELPLEYFPDVTNKKPERVTSFEELGLDEMEPFKYDFVDKQESSSLPGVSMELANDIGTEEGFNSSVGFDTEALISNVAGIHQVATVCVWCAEEFKVDAFDTEAQSDTIGYMCPTCKDKISGHFDRICPADGCW